MKSFILISIALMANVACIKQNKTQSSERDIIQSLNKNESESALIKIEEELKKNPNNDELIFYKTSALSQKGGVDVYSLFPLLKMKVFEVALTQWKENQEYEKKFKQRQTNLGGLTELESDDQQKQIDDYSPPKKENIKYKIVNGWYNNYWNNGWDDKNCQLAIVVATNLSTQEIYSYDFPNKENCEKLNKLSQKNGYSFQFGEKDSEIIENVKSAINMDKLYERIFEIDKKNFEKRKDKKEETKNSIRYMNLAWSLVDSIPILKKTPSVSLDYAKSLEEAQDLLVKLMNRQGESNLGNKASQQLALISSLKIVTHLKNGIELDHVNEAIDLLCKANSRLAEELFDAGSDFHYLYLSQKNSEFAKKNLKQYNEKLLLIEYYNKLSKNDETKKRFIENFNEELEDFQEFNCDQKSQEIMNKQLERMKAKIDK